MVVNVGKAVPVALGFLEYCFRPSSRVGWGGPFNAQEQRQKIFKKIVKAVSFSAIVETGSYRGVTSTFMQKFSDLPVFTVEALPRNYGHLLARSLGNNEIHTCLSDSREGLDKFLDRLDLKRPIFFYLDAHWDADLPLAEELQIIWRRCSSAIVMIDDFRVSDDTGYKYDDYGQNKALDLDYVIRAIGRPVGVFFPAACSDIETGSKSGCVVLCQEQQGAQALSGISELKPHLW